MGDVAQILSGSLPEMAGSSKSAAAVNKSTPTMSLPPPQVPRSYEPSRSMELNQKMTGMSKEVMHLLGGRQDKNSAVLPPIVPTFSSSGKSSPVPAGDKTTSKDTTIKVGSRWISANKPAREWVWAPFASSARTDGALFHHWCRANVEYVDHPFARFDIHLDPITYTNDQYQRLLQDPLWTKSETDKLMDLARRFELRWAVIYDRWIETYQSSGRKIEDLQYRYYSVAALLTQASVAKEAAAEAVSLSKTAPNSSNSTENKGEEAKEIEKLVMEQAAARAIETAEPQHQPLIAMIGTGTTNKNFFDLNKERERRAHLEFIWNRTKEEEQEEAELRKELRLVEAQLRKLKKSGGHILAAAESGTGSRSTSRSVTPVPVSTVAAGAAPATLPETSDADVLDQCFASTAPTPMPQTPYLQSGRLIPPAIGGNAGINKSTLKRMDEVLAELKIPERPIPTKRVCDLYDNVRKDALTLLTLQKMVIQKEGQLQSKRLRLGKLVGGARAVDEETLLGITPPPSTASSTTSGTTGRGKGGKTSKGSRGSGGGKGKAGSSKSDGTATGDGTGKGGKGKSTSTKRKKKASADSKSSSAGTAAAAASTLTSATPANPAQPVAAGKTAPTASSTTNQGDEGKPAKKRARKTQNTTPDK